MAEKILRVPFYHPAFAEVRICAVRLVDHLLRSLAPCSGFFEPGQIRLEIRFEILQLLPPDGKTLAARA